MKKIAIITGIAALSFGAVIACSSGSSNSYIPANPATTETTTPPLAGTSALPALNMVDAQGKAVNLQSFKGKKVFVNLWASWCPPCRAEMPSIQKLYNSVDKNKVAFVMLSYDDNPLKSTSFMKRNKLSLPVYFPSEQPPALFQPDGIPATFIFDEQGNIIEQNIGAEDYDTEAYRQLLK